jgi:hypothetical protein
MPAPIFAKRARSACYLAYNHIVCLVGAYSVTQSGGTRARGAACHPKRRRTDSRLLLRRKIMRACVHCLLVWHGVFRKGLDGDMSICMLTRSYSFAKNVYLYCSSRPAACALGNRLFTESIVCCWCRDCPIGFLMCMLML